MADKLMHIIFSKNIKDGINFANDKLNMQNSGDHFILSNNLTEINTKHLTSKFPNALTFFVTKGTEPGDLGVWDANFIVDEKEDIKRWKELIDQY